MKPRLHLFGAVAALCLGALPITNAQESASKAPSSDAPAPVKAPTDPIEQIKDEGLNRSQVMKTLSYLTDVIGGRLTGSPNLKRANEWTREQFASWGLTNAHLEPWGPFGRGWSLKRFSAQIVEPQTIPLIAWPKAWSPGFSESVTGEVVYLDAKDEAELEKYAGKLKGAVVLISPPRELKAHFEPPGARMTESNLLRLANATTSLNTIGSRITGGSGTTNTPPSASASQRASSFAAQAQASRRLPFAAKEGAALVVSPSFTGDGGTLFVSAATVPSPYVPGTNTPTIPSRNSPWQTNVALSRIPPQITLTAEDYNRLVRMIQQGVTPKMAVDLQVKFHEDDLMAYNTVAEISGTDLKDEIVMLGAHMDSWHSGTGATDNGAGVAVCMEAVRILSTLNLQPRRTIRVGLWSGEEEGLLGSKAYVGSHFGKMVTNPPPDSVAAASSNGSDAKEAKGNGNGKEATSKGKSKGGGRGGFARPSAPQKLETQPEYEKLSAYFNLDNGTGKVRGVYMQGNEAVRPIFRQWLAPFRDLGADTLSLATTGGTDHLSFDAIGLPGFQFIQDSIEYETRTHHSNMDVFDRIQADDLKQASVIMASFVYQAAMRDEKLPRKPRPGQTTENRLP
jgi:hypothetical protein